MNKWMPTASAVFLSLSIVPGWAEIKEFNSGDRILAEEMNQNFEYLVQELEKLGSNEVDCDSYDYIGVWVGFSIDEGDPERLVLLVAGAGSVSAYFDLSSGERFQAEGSYALASDDYCTYTSTLDFPLIGRLSFQGIRSYDSSTMTLLTVSDITQEYGNYIMVKSIATRPYK
tara:strand:+ start:7346 stop:7861 length:516 start_codon:yes stop_codon:yes gene_type:complete